MESQIEAGAALRLAEQLVVSVLWVKGAEEGHPESIPESKLRTSRQCEGLCGLEEEAEAEAEAASVRKQCLRIRDFHANMGEAATRLWLEPRLVSRKG